MARPSEAQWTPTVIKMHLLAALVGRPGQSTVVAAQSEVGPKTNEVPKATQVLDQVDLADTVVTADALHTVKATAAYIHRRGGHFMLPVKQNRCALSRCGEGLLTSVDMRQYDRSPVCGRNWRALRG
jgi:hypothetical protein